MTFLISAAWTTMEGQEMGLKVSQGELNRAFSQERRGPYPTEVQLRRYLIERHLVLSDLLYQLKSRILVSRILPRFQARVERAGGGEKVYARLALKRYHALIARTSCQTGYIVPNCKEYHGPETVSPSPNVILERIARGS